MLNFDPEPGMSLTSAVTLARCAKIAYSAPAAADAELRAGGMTAVRWIDRDGTQAFVAGNAQAVVLSFRGTEPTRIEDVFTDVNFTLTDGYFGAGDRVHQGFKTALDSAWNDVTAGLSAVQTGVQPLWITGHSLGAALASLAAARLWDAGRRSAGVYTFGSPRVGNEAWAGGYDARLRSRTFRFVNQSDIVTRVPLWTMHYRHVGTAVYIDESGRLRVDPPGWWTQVLDTLLGAVSDLRSLGAEAFRDHAMDLYLSRIEAAKARG